MQIAEAQGRSIPEAMDANPSSHLPLWAAWFERKLKEPEVTHYYLAQIAAEVRRTRAKRPSSVKLEHCLIKFRPRAKSQDGTSIKSVFLMALGLRPDGTRNPSAVQRRARVHVPREVRERSRMTPRPGRGMRERQDTPDPDLPATAAQYGTPRRRTRPDIRLRRNS